MSALTSRPVLRSRSRRRLRSPYHVSRSQSPRQKRNQAQNVSRMIVKSKSKVQKNRVPVQKLNPTSKNVAEELRDLLPRCDPNCKHCEEYILQLTQHIHSTHECDDDDEQFFHSLIPNVPEEKENDQESPEPGPPLYDDNDDDESFDENEMNVEPETDETLQIDPETKPIPPKRKYKPRILTKTSGVKVRRQTRDKLPSPFKCRVEGCDRAFTTDGRRRLHDQRIHGGIRPSIYKCEECGSIFTSSITYRRHQRVKHDPNHVPTIDYRCSNCSMKFQSPNELEAHVLLHSQESSHFTCIICSTIFSNSIDLKVHMKTNHLDSVGPADEIIGKYKCEECGLACKSKSGLRHHKQRHQGDLPFKCTVVTPGQGQCTSAFVKQVELDEHMISHSDSKGYQCDICGKELKYKKGLSRHRKRHEALKDTGRFRYECKVCPKTFNENYALKRHEETHSKINPYVCEVCGKTFSVHHNYFLHAKIHKKNIGEGQISKSKSKTPATATTTIQLQNTKNGTMIILDTENENQNEIGNELQNSTTSVLGYLVGMEEEADPEETKGEVDDEECEWSTIVVTEDGVEQSENFECFIHTGSSNSNSGQTDVV